MQDRDQHRVISNELAAIIGGLILILPIVYWVFAAGGTLLNIYFMKQFIETLPRNWWLVNIGSCIAVWFVNRLSIWVDRYGEMECLPINKIEINVGFFLLFVQIAVFIGKEVL